MRSASRALRESVSLRCGLCERVLSLFAHRILNFCKSARDSGELWWKQHASSGGSSRAKVALGGVVASAIRYADAARLSRWTGPGHYSCLGVLGAVAVTLVCVRQSFASHEKFYKHSIATSRCRKTEWLICGAHTSVGRACYPRS